MNNGDVTTNNTRSSCINVTIPQELQEHKLWSVWLRVVTKDGIKKIPKNPHNISWDGSWKSDNLQTLEYCQKLLTMYPELGGVAYSLRPPYTLVDIDDCIINGRISDELESDIKRFNTFTEISQSGNSIHIIGKGKPPGAIGGYDEVYSEGHWVYITGNLFPGSPVQINDITGVLTELFEERKDRVSARKKVCNNLESLPKYNKVYDRSITEDYEIDCSSIGMPDDPTEVSPGVYQGGNPFHGSRCGFNFRLDTRNNVWKCFRNHGKVGEHGGGSGLELFAISEGLLECEDSKPGWFNDKEKQKQVFKALEDRGYIKIKDKWRRKFNRKVRK